MKEPRDDYGYAAAAMAGLNMFEKAARRTGRTQRMIDRLQDGDCVIVLNAEHARHLRKRLADAGKKVDIAIYPNRLDDGRRSKGRTYFDHPLQFDWVKRAILNAAEHMSREEDRLSYLPAAEQTKAYAITRWTERLSDEIPR